MVIDLFDIEKVLYCLFFYQFRRLRQAGKLMQWLCVVTVPFYICIGILNMLVTADMQGFSNYQLLAVDMLFTVAVPMTIVSFANSVL